MTHQPNNCGQINSSPLKRYYTVNETKKKFIKMAKHGEDKKNMHTHTHIFIARDQSQMIQ